MMKTSRPTPKRAPAAKKGGRSKKETQDFHDVGRSRMPIAWMWRVNTLPKARSLSRNFGFKPSSRPEAVAQHEDEKEGNCERRAIMSVSLAFANLQWIEFSEPTRPQNTRTATS
jgi:hypothetical protein